MVIISKYYCTECKRFHVRGKIHKEHLKYKKSEQTEDIETKDEKEMNEVADKLENAEEIGLDEIDMEIELEELRNVAQRQITRLLEKAIITDQPDLYKREIKRLLVHEGAF